MSDMDNGVPPAPPGAQFVRWATVDVAGNARQEFIDRAYIEAIGAMLRHALDPENEEPVDEAEESLLNGCYDLAVHAWKVRERRRGRGW